MRALSPFLTTLVALVASLAAALIITATLVHMYTGLQPLKPSIGARPMYSVVQVDNSTYITIYNQATSQIVIDIVGFNDTALSYTFIHNCTLLVNGDLVSNNTITRGVPVPPQSVALLRCPAVGEVKVVPRAR